MRIFAQTNIQLLNQLRRLDYSENEMLLVHQGYTLAMQIFSGQYRPSGKPFICHLVGTASILADQRASIELVAAGLLHAAYTYGEFGSGYKSNSAAKRDQVRRSIGEKAEELVSKYAQYAWDRQVVLVLPDQDFDQLTDISRGVLLLRLANELEEHLDLGAVYCDDAERRKQAIDSYLVKLVDVAHKLHYDDLGSLFRDAFHECMSENVGGFPKIGTQASFSLAPLSYRLRLGARINTFIEDQGRTLLRTGLGWRRGNAVERRIKETIDRWTVRFG